LWALLEKRWFLRPFIRHLPLKLAPVILESYLVEKNPVTVSISGQSNPMLQALGVNENAIPPFRSLVERLISQPSFESILHLFQTLGRGNPNLQKYLDAAEQFNRNKIGKKALYALTNPPEVLHSVENFVREQPAYIKISGK
jgi:hypothetical protein